MPIKPTIRYKEDLNQIKNFYAPSFHKLISPEHGTLYLMGSKHNHDLKITEQMRMLLDTITIFACESTDIALLTDHRGLKSMDSQLMQYIMHNTYARVITLESKKSN